jgi:hypothetical protein
VDEQMRAVMRAKVERHQKSRRWAVLGRTRCRGCGLKWPCLAYERARRALDGQSSTVDWARLGTEPRIAMAPLRTYGQRYRSAGGSR